MPVRLAENSYLLQVYILHSRALLQYTLRCFIKILIICGKISQQAPFALKYFQIASYKKNFQVIFLKSKYCAVNSNRNSG